MKKKLLSLTLGVLLIMNLLSLPALAAGGQEFVIENGVLTGYNGPGGHVTIPAGVTSIGSRAFADSKTITSVTIPGSVSTVGAAAFEGCRVLTSVTMDEGVTTLGTNAFHLCQELTQIVIPRSLNSVGYSVFQDTPWLERTIQNCGSDFVIVGGTLLKYKGSAERVVIPAGVIDIDTSAFLHCDTMRSLTFTNPERYSETAKTRTTCVWSLGTCPNLEELINCPNEKYGKNWSLNKAALAGWINPGSYVFTPKNEEFTRLSNQITAGLTSDYEKAAAIVQWLDENITYDITTEGSSKNTAELVLQRRTAVCEGYANLCRFLMASQGIPCRVMIGRADLSTSGMHAWNICFIDGRWIWLEPQGEFDIPFPELCRNYGVYEPVKTVDKNIPSDWAKDVIWETICAKFTPFDLQKEYRSDITREEFCRLMVKLVEQKSGMSIDAYLRSRGVSRQSVFTDTSSADVQAAYALGIVSGTSATTFGPDLPITRQEAAVMLSRAGKLLGLNARGGQTFADAKSFASWAAEGITFVSGLTDPSTGSRVMNDTGSGNFSPLSHFTREQGIITAWRMLHCI